MMNDVVELAANLKATRRDNSTAITILLTGCSSGIGLYAAKLLAIIDPRNRLILVARTQEKACEVKKQVLETLAETTGCPGVLVQQQHQTEGKYHVATNKRSFAYSDHIIALGCDHCSLQSVRDFSTKLRQKLDETFERRRMWARNGIDVMCLNAAVLMPKQSVPNYTEDGLEVTFQTNHLAPFLMINILFDRINPAGRIILTSSGLHAGEKLHLDGIMENTEETSTERDPIARKGFAMIDGSEYHFKRSYALSKLCNIAVCAELNERMKRVATMLGLEPAEACIANCFSPGLMVDSGLFRHQWVPGSKDPHPLTLMRPEVRLMAKSVEWGAGALVYMIWSDDAGKRGGEFWRDADSPLGSKALYGEHFSPVPIKQDAEDRRGRKLLWKLSCQLAGIDD